MAFARSRPPIRQRVELVEAEHRADDVVELLRHLRILVKDSAKKLQASNERHNAEQVGGGEVEGPPSESSPPSIFCYPRTNTFYQWLNRIGPPLTAHGR
jgi:hypothetical protein